MNIDQVSDVVAAKLARSEVEKKCFGSAAGDPFAASMLVPEESWQSKRARHQGLCNICKVCISLFGAIKNQNQHVSKCDEV